MNMDESLPRGPRAVLFDMDGLMLDSEREAQRCLLQAAGESGQSLSSDDLLGMVGKDDASARAYLAGRLGQSPAEALLARSRTLYLQAVARGIAHRPGIVPLLDWLSTQGVVRAVGTATERALALRKLEGAGLLPYFATVVTRSDVQLSKPAPDIYLLAAARLGLAPADCLVLEDSPIGVRAALAAGCEVIQIPDLVLPDAQVRALGHRIVASLDEVKQLLQARLSAS